MNEHNTHTHTTRARAHTHTHTHTHTHRERSALYLHNALPASPSLLLPPKFLRFSGISVRNNVSIRQRATRLDPARLPMGAERRVTCVLSSAARAQTRPQRHAPRRGRRRAAESDATHRSWRSTLFSRKALETPLTTESLDPPPCSTCSLY